MMVHNTQNYWASELCPQPGILNTRKHNVSETVLFLFSGAERTVFARSNTAIVGSNPTEAWMFVCVLCAFILCLHSLR
jgi:hypothetical protein